MNDVQKALCEKRYRDGQASGLFWGILLGFICGIALTFVVVTTLF